MPKVGVLRLSALGDAVLTIPLIETLVASSRFSEVVWITTQPVVELLGPIEKCRFVVVEKTNSQPFIETGKFFEMKISKP